MKPLMISVPASARAVMERLEQHGYEAYIVGGCVRDSLIGRTPGDWDVTTSARPEETAACFPDFRTVETGMKHGTLTVLSDGAPIEVTTYRLDGEYLDNRHPLRVTFSDRIEEDLARRDFTVNAMAYHPERGLIDLYGGQRDLEHRMIRCVGDPATRFHEDGLRILRAIRFASVLDFEIAPETARAVHECRALLSNIAAERIRDEFRKLICGAGAVRVLTEYSDVIAKFLPELGECIGFEQNSKYHCYDVYEHTVRALGYAPDDLIVRLAVLFHDVAKPRCYTRDALGGHFNGHGTLGTEMTGQILRRLRFDNDTVARVTALVDYHDREIPPEPRSVKRLMQKFSDEEIGRLVEVKRCDRLAHAEPYRELSGDWDRVLLLMRQIRESDACLSLRTMKLNGDDLLSLGVPAGKEIGQILSALLEQVIDGSLPNDHDRLLEAAKKKIRK